VADEQLLNVWDYERAASKRLDPGPYGYVAGGAGDEHTLRDNVAAFRRWRLRPRVLVDVSETTTETQVLGKPLSMPIVVAPMGIHRIVHPDGEEATVRAAAAARTIFCLSTSGTATVEAVAEAAPDCRRWFQLYWRADREFVRELLGHAVGAGYDALVLTVDLPAFGRRERDFRNRFEFAADLEMPYRTRPELDPHVVLGGVVDPRLTWRDLEWLRENCPLPLVVKGILTAEDALLAVEHGAAAVAVSNHGGRQLDNVPASLDALPEVVEAAADRVEVYMDGGIRRGTDVAVALALGARAVLVGRPVLWGLAVDGEGGVARVLELLRAELELTLKLLGCRSPTEVTRAHVTAATPA
jgi:isopentenyl diphosphate isomerase/L-lactate dehydrogenase-like FMN-dependent dehydrogenase